MFRAGGAAWGPAPSKTLGAAPLRSSLVPLCWGMRGPVRLPGERVWKPGDSRTSPRASLANCACPSAVRRRREGDCVLRPVSPPSGSPNPAMVLGTPPPPPPRGAVPAFS